MKEIIRYQARDGVVFNTAKQAEEHERLITFVELAMKPLGNTPEAVRNGKGWVHHDPEKVRKAKDDILDICRWNGLNNHPAFKHRGRDIHPHSAVGRILCDMGGPLAVAWARFGCIDDSGREHQQPYFAVNGPEYSQVCVEDRR